MSKTEILEKIKVGLQSLPPLLSRQFTNPGKTTESTGHAMRVMQWNILAQALALGTDNFVRCPSEALSWSTRKYRILEEILRYESDIICLQELDVFPYVNGKLEKFGYDGIFFPKPDSPCLDVAGPNGGRADGCAIFYRTSKYRLVDSLSTPLQVGTKRCNQVTVMGLFEAKDESSRQFVVANTHLKAKKGHDELRHNQGLDLLAKIQQFAGDKAVIVCGDFNAEPSEAVYSAFDKSSLNLSSAYKVLNNGCEPEYTTWKIRGSASATNQTEFCRTIDYVWISKERVEAIDYLKFSTGDEVGPGRLPSYSYASDHFSLVVDLLLK